MSLSKIEKKEIRGILKNNDYNAYRYLMDNLDDNNKLMNDVLEFLALEFENKLNIENYSANIVLKYSKAIKEILERKIFDCTSIGEDILGSFLRSKTFFQQLKQAKNLSCEELEENIDYFYNLAFELLNKEEDEEVKNLNKEKEQLCDTIKELKEELKQTKERISSLENGLKKQQLKNEQKERNNIKLFQEICALKKNESSLTKEKNDNSLKRSELEKAKENLLKEKESLIDKVNFLEKRLQYLIDTYNEQGILLDEQKQKLIEKDEETKEIEMDNYIIIQGLKKELLELRKKEIKESISFDKDYLVKEVTKEEILVCLLGKLSDKEPHTLEELTTYLKMKGYRLNKKNVYEFLNELTSRFNILEQSDAIPTTYQLSSLNTSKTNKRIFTCSKDDYCVSFLVIADTHISKVDTDVIKGFDEVYNYCETHSIKNILHLGDFFHFLTSHSTSDEELYKESLLIDDATRLLPASPSITMSILGGNHDKNLHSKGLKTIERLVNMRSDYHFLGYDHVGLRLGKEEEDLFMLHHSNKRLLPIDTESGFDISELLKKRESFYAYLKYPQKEYIDLCGHFHASYFNKEEMICCCPSLFKDRFSNGAWQVKVYLVNNNISYIVFTELELNQKLEEKKDYVLARKM